MELSSFDLPTIFLAALMVALGVYTRTYLTKYLEEKGKNAATHEDIARLTKEVERVRLDYVRQTEELKAKLQLTIAREQAHGARVDAAVLSLFDGVVDLHSRLGRFWANGVSISAADLRLLLVAVDEGFFLVQRNFFRLTLVCATDAVLIESARRLVEAVTEHEHKLRDSLNTLIQARTEKEATEQQGVTSAQALQQNARLIAEFHEAILRFQNTINRYAREYSVAASAHLGNGGVHSILPVIPSSGKHVASPAET